MNRGIVVKQHKRYTVIMDQQGQFHKAAPIEDVAIGVETSFTPKQISRYQSVIAQSFFQRKVVAIAVILLLAIFPVYSMFNQNSVYAYVNIDINPSVELAIDRDMMVEDITPLNKDAELLLQQLNNLKGNPVDYVTDQIISKSKELNWVTTMNTVLIGIHYERDPDKNKLVTETIDEYFKKQPKEDMKIATFEIPDEVREDAEEKKVSMNQSLADSITQAKTDVEEKEIDEEAKIDEEEKELIEAYYKESNKKRTIVKQKPKVEKATEKLEEKQEKKQEKEIRKEEKQEVKEEQKENKSEQRSNEKNNSSKQPNPQNKDDKETKKKELPPGLEKKLEKELKDPKLKSNLEEIAPYLNTGETVIPTELEEKLEDLPPGIRKKLEDYLPKQEDKQKQRFPFNFFK
ncbi:anti-sigma factor domain-containing protein [Aquibacillus salsiterrae]|uniref:RsgI N-terminal anti-sigma domain-containing protein n=1 Tax=Aquibacillus salsiterrae TaxID=2950439 RepID=A0A9X4AFH8_9BACI|nr:hypothetical protein [Aquibacillus salsiterrae]MDC3417684.1 hypothetical protein [Aquibacillus salsiterrae]